MMDEKYLYDKQKDALLSWLDIIPMKRGEREQIDRIINEMSVQMDKLNKRLKLLEK